MLTYTREIYKFMRDSVGHTVASTTAGSVDSKTLNSTTVGAFTGSVYGAIFDLTIKCTTGTIYVAPNSTVPVSAANGYPLDENESLTFKAKTAVQVVGNSTTAGFSAMVWADFVG